MAKPPPWSLPPSPPHTGSYAPSPTTLDNAQASSTDRLFAAAIGRIGTTYYVRVFQRFEADAHAGPRWNWAAGLCSLSWMLFRRLWGAALAYVGGLCAALVLLGMMRVVFRFSPVLDTALLLGIGALSIALPGLWGNALLYQQSQEKITIALAKHTTLEQACLALSRQASNASHLAIASVLYTLGMGCVLYGFLR
jgi:hypothetical protein